MDRVKRDNARKTAHRNAKYHEVHVYIPKGRKSALDAYAAAKGESINSIVNHYFADILGLTIEDWKSPLSDESRQKENC